MHAALHDHGGRLKSIVRVASDTEDNVRYGLASFRWFNAPSYLLDDSDEEKTDA